jgi:AcrR family transcriptional regulator
MSTSPLDRELDRLPLRERKKLKTRRAIQDHALRLFAEQGYDETTVEQIADAAEISPSTFFRYFPTKEDTVLTDEYDPVMAEVFRAQPAELGPLGAMRSMFAAMMERMYEADRDTILTRVRLIQAVPALRAKSFDAMHHSSIGMFAQLVAERADLEPEDMRVRLFTWAVMGAIQAAIFTWADSDGALDLPKLMDEALEFLANGCPL